ncbi:hypothetical protein [Aquihabitans sp. G128]|nr:hypothetical protein [Aquihabitans sp. G128]
MRFVVVLIAVPIALVLLVGLSALVIRSATAGRSDDRGGRA